MAFQAVIFDFGGVITSSPFEAFNRLEAERALPRDFVRRVNAVEPDILKLFAEAAFHWLTDRHCQ